MPAKPDDNYSPTPSVSPETGSANDYLTIRANPDQFGAQIGEAQERLGATGVDAGNKANDVLIQRQGMLNEAGATQAETTHAIASGAAVSKFKSLEGFDAVPGSPAYTEALASVQKSQADIAASLPNDAMRRTFLTLSGRHTANAIEDINDYAAGQVKHASNLAFQSSAEVAAARSGDYAVASNDARFGASLGDLTSATAGMVHNQGYGPGMKQDPNTGAISFTSDDAGKAAESVYTNTHEKYVGAAWVNRIHTLAEDPTNGNFVTAANVFKKNYNDIPPEARQQISAYLTPRVRTYQAAKISNDAVYNADQAFNSFASGKTPAAPTQPANSNEPSLSENDAKASITKLFPGATITSEQRNPEHNAEVGGAANSMHLTGQAIDFRAPEGTTLDQVKSQLTAQGFPATEVLQEIGGKPTSEPVFHVGWRPKGGATQQASTQTPYQYVQGDSKVDFYRRNEDAMIENSGAVAQAQMGDDPVAVEQAKNQTRTRITQAIGADEAGYAADLDTVHQAMQGNFTDGVRPTSSAQLAASNKQVATAWNNTITHNPYAAQTIENVFTANAAGKAAGFGQNFYRLFQQVTAPSTDPGRIADPSKLWGYVQKGEGAPLTNTGLGVLTDILKDSGTSQGASTIAQMRSFFANAHTRISGANPTLGTADPKGDVKFGQFMVYAMDLVAAQKQSGKPVSDLFNKDKPEYLGNDIGNYDRPLTQKLNDLIHDYSNPNAAAADITNLADLAAAVKNGKVSRAAAVQIGIKHGWLRPSAPAAPPPPQVPLPPGAGQ